MLGKDLYKKADGTYLPLYIGSKSIYEGQTGCDGHQHRGNLVLTDAEFHRA